MGPIWIFLGAAKVEFFGYTWIILNQSTTCIIWMSQKKIYSIGERWLNEHHRICIILLSNHNFYLLYHQFFSKYTFNSLYEFYLNLKIINHSDVYRIHNLPQMFQSFRSFYFLLYLSLPTFLQFLSADQLTLIRLWFLVRYARDNYRNDFSSFLKISLDFRRKLRRI